MEQLEHLKREKALLEEEHARLDALIARKNDEAFELRVRCIAASEIVRSAQDACFRNAGIPIED